MKTQKSIVLLAGISFAAAILLIDPQPSTRAVQLGLEICAQSLLPALFPFFVITELWCRLGLPQRLEHVTAPFTERLFHLPGIASGAIFLGMLGGYPVGARMTATLYKEGHLTREEAQHTLRFCNNAGPAFIIGIVGSLFHRATAAVLLWGIHIFCALLLGLLFRPGKRPSANHTRSAIQHTPFTSALTVSIQNAGETVLQVSTYVLFFAIISEYLQEIGLDCPLKNYLLGSLELAGGMRLLNSTMLSAQTRFVACSGLLGWGGMCVHCQSLATIYNAGLSGRSYIFAKLLHGLMSAALACLLAPYCCSDIQRIPTKMPWPVVPAISVLLLGILLLILKTSSGKKAGYTV